MHTQPVRHDGSIRPLECHAGLAEGHVVPGVRHSPAYGTIEVLVLEEQHRVWLLNGGQQKPFGILRRAGHDDLQPRYVGEPRLHALRMERSRPDVTAERGTDRHVERCAPPVVCRRQIVYDLVEPAGDKIRVLDFQDGLEAFQRQAHGRPDGPTLYDRRIADPLGAELLDEPLRHLEDPAVRSYILPKQHDAIVGLHCLAQPLAHCIDKALLGRGVIGRHVVREGGSKDFGALGLQRAFDLRLPKRVFSGVFHFGYDGFVRLRDGLGRHRTFFE